MNQGFDYEQVVFGSNWELKRSDRNLGGLRLDRALCALESRNGDGQGTILEVGCGVGRFTVQLAKHLPTMRIVGSDLSQAAIGRAARRGQRPGYAVANALALPHADSSVDAVVFFDLLEHLEQPSVALAEFARVMRPGGMLHGFVPCESQPGTLHWLLQRWVHQLTRRHAGHVQHYRHTDIVALARRVGFEIAELSYSVHPWGQALDLMTFATREVIYRRRKHLGAQPDAFYDRSILGSGRLVRAYGQGRAVADTIAYLETQLFRWCPCAVGLHLTASKSSSRHLSQCRLEEGGNR